MMADKLLSAATVCFLLGTLGLYGYSVEMEPDMLGSGGVVGSYVYVEGMVRQVKKGWGGTRLAEVLSDGKAPSVWLQVDDALLDTEPVSSGLLTGARVRAEGILDEYKGVKEIALAYPEDLSLLSSSSMKVVWDRAPLLNNTSVCFRGTAYYKHVSGSYLTFRLVDTTLPGCELNCSTSYYTRADETAQWDNGTTVRVIGWLRYRGDPVSPHIYLSGGAKGVEVPG